MDFGEMRKWLRDKSDTYDRMLKTKAPRIHKSFPAAREVSRMLDSYHLIAVKDRAEIRKEIEGYLSAFPDDVQKAITAHLDNVDSRAKSEEKHRPIINQEFDDVDLRGDEVVADRGKLLTTFAMLGSMFKGR
jgi:hypothetical protein